MQKGGYANHICFYLWSRKLKNSCQTLPGTHSYPACDMNPKEVIPTQSQHCSKLHNRLAIALGSHTCPDGCVQRHWSCLRPFSLCIVFRTLLKCHLLKFGFFPRYLAWESVIQSAFVLEAWRQCKVKESLKVSPLPQLLVMLDQVNLLVL